MDAENVSFSHQSPPKVLSSHKIRPVINTPMNKEMKKKTVAVVAPMAVMLVIACWGLDRGGIWRDEAATFQVARRTVPQIWRLLHEVDAVHGLYYLLMRPVLAVHPGEVLLRLPSVAAAVTTTGLVAALGTRLARPRVGLWAGLLYAVTPMVGHYAQEGRSYAMVAAGATAATLLLVQAAGGRSWTAYGAVLAVTCLLHEFAVLLFLAHAVTLALARLPQRVWAGWLCAAGAVTLALLPLALLSHAQSAQVAWLRPPGQAAVDHLVHQFVAPTDEILVPCLILMYVALRRPWSPRGHAHGRGLTLPAVALPLLLVPPATLMTVSQWSPLYDARYVLYALAGAPCSSPPGPTGSRGPCRGCPRSPSRSPERWPWPSSARTSSRCCARTVPWPSAAATTSPPPPHSRPANCAPATRCCSCRPSDGARHWRTPRGFAGPGTWRSAPPRARPARCTASRSARTRCGGGWRCWTGCGWSPSRTPCARLGPRGAPPTGSSGRRWRRSSSRAGSSRAAG